MTWLQLVIVVAGVMLVILFLGAVRYSSGASVRALIAKQRDVLEMQSDTIKKQSATIQLQSDVIEEQRKVLEERFAKEAK